MCLYSYFLLLSVFVYHFRVFLLLVALFPSLISPLYRKMRMRNFQMLGVYMRLFVFVYVSVCVCMCMCRVLCASNNISLSSVTMGNILVKLGERDNFPEYLFFSKISAVNHKVFCLTENIICFMNRKRVTEFEDFGFSFLPSASVIYTDT